VRGRVLLVLTLALVVGPAAIPTAAAGVLEDLEKMVNDHLPHCEPLQAGVTTSPQPGVHVSVQSECLP